VPLPVFLALCIALIAGLGIAEYALHRRNLAAIPIRIHVNGTRGKSSVVRLIAGALRAHGVRVCAKATGSLPRMIMADGTEYPIHRAGHANIIEHLRIIGVAAREGAEALVIECMALQPRLQALSELMMVRSTHGVITNARADHLDVMGPTERDVALALLGSVPRRAVLFTGEPGYRAEFEAACADRETRLVALSPADFDAVSDQELARFPYVEHKQNVALALAVARELGVPRDVALRGMVAAAPDVGALREYELDFFGRRIVVVNGFAANDPLSTEQIWRLTLERHPQVERRIMVVNCRFDRPDRSRQLGEAIPRWQPADRYLLVGTGTYVFARTAVAAGLHPGLLMPLEGMDRAGVFEEIVGACGRNSLVMGVGNIGGIGLELVRHFRNRARPDADEIEGAMA
jgi:poly-gamma-glutamate synthase PgsB/CapB